MNATEAITAAEDVTSKRIRQEVEEFVEIMLPQTVQPLLKRLVPPSFRQQVRQKVRQEVQQARTFERRDRFDKSFVDIYKVASKVAFDMAFNEATKALMKGNCQSTVLTKNLPLELKIDRMNRVSEELRRLSDVLV